ALRIGSADPEGTLVYILDNVIDASLLWAVGITDRLELTLVAPVTLFQDGSGLGPVLGTQEELPRSAVRDPRFGLTYALLPRPRRGTPAGLAVTSRLEFGIPIGDEGAFASASSMVANPGVVGDYRLGRFDFGLELGARIRTTDRFASARIGTQA